MGGAEAQQARQPRGKKAGAGTKTVKRSAVVPEPFTAAPAPARPLLSTVIRAISSRRTSFGGWGGGRGEGGARSWEVDATEHNTRKLTPAEKDLKLQSFKSYTFD